MTSAPPSSTPSLLPDLLGLNLSVFPYSQPLNASTAVPVRSPGLGMSCFTMTFGAISNLTALGILGKSYVRLRQRRKTSFLLLAVGLLLADLGGHVIPGSFAMYLHLVGGRRHGAIMQLKEPARELCQVFGVSLVFFGLCSLFLGFAMAAERCIGITQPLFHAAVITMTHIRVAVLLLLSLALLLALLPLLNIGTYAVQYPGTWCFLTIHDPHSGADTVMALAFSGMGLLALTLTLLCNGLSGLALLHSRVTSKRFKLKSASQYKNRTLSLSSSSSSASLCSLDVEMIAQLAALTVVSCVCWSPFLVHIFVSVMPFYQPSSNSVHQSERMVLLGLRMASWNQILDPWVYILLRRSVLHRVCCALRTERDPL